MTWAALVPLKPAALRKGRLAERLSPTQREALSVALLERLLCALRGEPDVTSIHLLSEHRPEGWHEGWLKDEGAGLNPAITGARGALGPLPLLVIHADLPLVAPADITALLRSAPPHGRAIAPDRHGQGTNAVALGAGEAFTFAFGPGSRATHERLNAPLAIVERTGLALDCDTPGDLDLAIAGGFVFPG